MKNRLEIKGKENVIKIALIMLASGYSIHIPYQEIKQDFEEDNGEYYVIEYSFTKYEEPSFILNEE